MYLYVFSDFGHAPGTGETKVGVSVNPEARARNIRLHGQYILQRKWLMPNRQKAEELETLVCNSFPKFKGKEWLAAYCDDVISFIEKHIENFGGKDG